MKDYNNGFRYISVFGESEEQKEKLDNFLKENNYDTEESSDALMILSKECIGINKDLTKEMKTFMTRVSEKEAEEFEDSIYNSFCDTVQDDIDYATKFTSDVITDFKVDLEIRQSQPKSTQGVY